MGTARTNLTEKPASDGNGGEPGKEITALDEKVANIRRGLDRLLPEFQAAMPTGVEAKQLIRDVNTAVRRVPKLAACDLATLYGAVMTAAQLGLRPNVLGQCFIIPYKRTATFVVGYKGLKELAYRSGIVKTLDAQVVYERDVFEYEKRAGGVHMIHRPELSADPGVPVLYYADAVMHNGGYAITRPWSVARMEAHRDRYVKAGDSPWRNDQRGPDGLLSNFDMMSLKTMIIVLSNMVPLGTDMATALVADNTVRVDLSPDADITDVAEQVIDGEVVNEDTGRVPDWDAVEAEYVKPAES